MPLTLRKSANTELSPFIFVGAADGLAAGSLPQK
jgi:hypothetical protein